ncbi:MAG: type II toxin-antitoxin system RelE/ParE family toxin [Bacteroidales bacterium]|nr:type II toxin-antitoxin system RelE/ParE family toxin [Bacteroidales bacterium]
MKILYDKNFEKSLEKLSNTIIKQRLEKLIQRLVTVDDITKLANVKRLQGYVNKYRIRIGNYRIVFALLDNETMMFITISHRKEVYKFLLVVLFNFLFQDF